MPETTVPNRSVLRAARETLARAERDLRVLAQREAASRDALTRAARTDGPRDERLLRAKAEAEAAAKKLQGARAAADRARGALADGLTAWLGDETDAGVDAELARLDAAYPIVMAPVRIETRFDTGGPDGPQLKVRVYPDTFVAEGHEPLLAVGELAAGQEYWGAVWGGGGELQAWRELLRKTSAPRAAFIVRATTPSNWAQRPDGEPAFPTLEPRDDAWRLDPQARLLPDRWLVLAYRGGKLVHRAAGAQVREPLALGFDPRQQGEAAADPAAGGLELDEKVAWTVDFVQAEAAGMAVRLRLDTDDLKSGFDRVLVLGVKGSLSPEDGGAGLARLLEDHHYDSGLSFLAQGTPTNNTDAARSAYPVPDPDGARSFAIERGAALDDPEGDGVRLMRALGLPTELAAHLEGADRREESGARAMNQALWPVTFGYYFEQILAPHVGTSAREQARRHFVEHVRGRGPFTAMRVRAQPYGLVPVTSLDRFAALSPEDPVEAQLPDLLRRLRGVWQAQVAQVPRVGKTGDADADLLAVLAMDASARQVRVRTVNGPVYYANLFALLGAEAAPWNAAQATIVDPLMTLIGRPDWQPRLSRLVFADAAKRFRYPLVAAPIADGVDLLAIFGFDFIRWIREATVDDLRDERLPAGMNAPLCLLYRMLRHGRLLEIARVAVDLQVAHGMAAPADRAELELIGVVDGTSDRPTVWHRLARPIPAVTGTMALGDFVTSHPDAPETTTLREYDAALKELEGRSAAELDLLFGETLDESSHRFDAWATSLATKRLFQLRERRPTGAHLGGFGWVENLRPVSVAPAANGGFIQAPSLQHATAAAVLRNGYLTRAGAEKLSCAVDLSSERVRMALQMLQAMREGQPLGAVLGEQFERGLHDRRVDWFIEPLRRRFPLAVGKSGAAGLSGGASDAGAARLVVDGLVLHKAWLAGSIALDGADFQHAGAPSSPQEQAQAAAEFSRLAAALDAVTDLLLAESVFQMVAGDAAAANANMDAMAKGVLPPEPAIAEQPRSGVPLTFRVGLVLADETTPSAGWPPAPTPRAAAEPRFDAWAGRLMGDPTAVRCRVTLQPDAAPGTTVEQTVTLAELRIRPSDVLAIARRERDGGGGPSELNARVAAAALEKSPQPARVLAITYARDPGWPRDLVRTFADLMTVAQAINVLAGASRALQPKDLCTPESVAGIDPAAAMSADADARAAAARDALEELSAPLGQALAERDRTAATAIMMRALAFGVGAPLSDGFSDEILLGRAAAVAVELDGRRAAAASAPDAVEVVKAVFGRDFVFLPRFLPPAPAEVQQSLAAAGELVPAGSTSPEAWLRQASRARAPLDRWRRLNLLSDALGASEGHLRLVQVPHRPGRRWVGLPFTAGEEPVPGTMSAALHMPVTVPSPGQPWAGLLLDQWNEIIPSPTVRTGLAVHYDSPGAEPPQVVLMAVSPDASKTWSLANLEAILNETLDLAKLRVVDLELLGALGQLAPAVYLAANAAGDTVSSPFTGAVVTEATALSRES